MKKAQSLMCVYIRSIQNGYRCQTTIHLDFINILCTSSMYSSSSSNSSISASVIFDLAVAFSCWQWENLISGESRALGSLSLIPSEILPLHDFFSDFLSPGFQCIKHPSTSSCGNWERLVPLLDILSSNPVIGPLWLSAQANKGWAKMEAWIQFKFN